MTDLLFDVVLSHIYSMTAKFHNFYTSDNVVYTN